MKKRFFLLILIIFLLNIVACRRAAPPPVRKRPESLAPKVEADLFISPIEVKQKLESGGNFLLIDVDNPESYRVVKGTIGGMVIPLSELERRLEELKKFKNQEIIVYSLTGQKSMQAVKILRRNGFPKAKSMKGGMIEYQRLIAP